MKITRQKIRQSGIFFVALLVIAALGACVSKSELSEDYAEALRNPPAGKAAHDSRRTVVFFLVDGLSIRTLTDGLSSGRLPNMDQHFPGTIYRARAPFPSLTFPSISSLLTEKPIDQNGIYGNLIVADGKRINFEYPTGYPKLNEMLGTDNIFSRLAKKGERSVSLDYAFHRGSTAHTHTLDLEAGVLIAEHEYESIDAKTMASLEALLRETPVHEWPAFIFVHLVGVDFISHEKGPQSTAVKEYLQKLDTGLQPVFKELQLAEHSHQRRIVTMLSADHGFDQPISKIMALEESLDPEIGVLNEGRFLGLYFPESWNAERRRQQLTELMQNPDLDVAAMSNGNQVEIRTKRSSLNFVYDDQLRCDGYGYGVKLAGVANCSDRLSAADNALFHPYFVSNLARYFRSSAHPHAVVVGQPGVAFIPTYAGQHGGPTAQELYVPLLMRNAQLGETTRVPALWELLHFL